MPPKARITKDDIINAGFGIIRRSGAECLNVRAVSSELGCSTQPIMYHYRTVDELKSDIYSLADEFHTQYIMDISGSDNPLLALGLNYIRFAAAEKHLFRFLFQSDKFRGADLGMLFSGEETRPIQELISDQSGLSGEQANELFEILFTCAHGIASMLANNSIEYDREQSERLLNGIFESYYLYLKSK